MRAHAERGIPIVMLTQTLDKMPFRKPGALADTAEGLE